MPDLTYRDAIAQALREGMQSNPDCFQMGEDIGLYGGSYVVTKGFLDEFGERRIRDTPISESAIVGVAIGAAIAGMKPVVELMTINFSLLAMDQIVNHAAKILYMSGGQVSIPCVIRMATGGGSALGAQHSQNLESWYARVPGLKVACPSTPYDALGMMRDAMLDPNPYLYIEHTLLYRTRGAVPDEWYTVPCGKSVVRRPGRDVTIVAYLRAALLAVEASERLAQEGIEAEVIDLRSLRPLDLEPVLASVEKTNHLVVAEDAWLSGGISGEIAYQVQERAFDYLDAPIARVTGADVPAPYSATLEQLAFPTADDVIRAVKQTLA